MNFSKDFILAEANGGATTVASVNLSDKKFASNYFGSWGEAGASAADVVTWCNEQIEKRERNLTNLRTLRRAAQFEMVSGMSVETLQELLSEKTKTA
jgi:hypothetical protein